MLIKIIQKQSLIIIFNNTIAENNLIMSMTLKFDTL